MNESQFEQDIANKLKQECDLVDWRMLKPHYKRGALIIVTEGLDLISAGVQISVDNTDTVSGWIADETLIKPTPEQAADWEQRNQRFRTVVIAPFVLIQMLKH